MPRQQQVRVKGRGHPRVGHEAWAGLEEREEGADTPQTRAVIRTRDGAEAIVEIRRVFCQFYARWAGGLMPQIDAEDTLQTDHHIAGTCISCHCWRERRQRLAAGRSLQRWLIAPSSRAQGLS